MRFSLLLATENVRVRFAPSPTGRLHLGSLRTAFFNFLFAKKHNGAFVLRIEDTDRQRIVPGCAEKFETTLSSFGLALDESPLRGGSYGPYVQSQRQHIYSQAAQRLLDSGHAYRCFCSADRLNLIRKNALRNHEIPRYDNRCRSLTVDDVQIRMRNGEESVIRFKFDKEFVEFKDVVYGNNKQLMDEGDFVIVKSDGFPTYHFANVVDDRNMAISHVIRGAEWLPSTPKHVKLYQAFEWTPPHFVHLPLITRDGKKKLSKRDEDAFIEYYTEEKGYLPLAVLNFLIRNGSGIRDFEPGRLYSLPELVQAFDENAIGTRDFMMDRASLELYGRLAFRSSAKQEILEMIAAQIRHKAPDTDPHLLQPAYVARVVDFISQNEETFSCLSDLATGDFAFFFGRPKSAQTLLHKFDPELVVAVLDKLLLQESFTVENVKSMAKGMKEVKVAAVMGITRCALIDSFQGPPLSELFDFFSPEECRVRIRNVRNFLDEQKVLSQIG